MSNKYYITEEQLANLSKAFDWIKERSSVLDYQAYPGIFIDNIKHQQIKPRELVWEYFHKHSCISKICGDLQYAISQRSTDAFVLRIKSIDDWIDLSCYADMDSSLVAAQQHFNKMHEEMTDGN